MDLITPGSMDSRSWNGAIDGLSITRDSIRSDIAIGELKPVFTRNAGFRNLEVVVRVDVEAVTPFRSSRGCVAKGGRRARG